MENHEILTKKVLLESPTGKSKLWVVENFTKDYFKDLNALELEISPKILVFGKQCKQNRDVGFFSNKSDGYKYAKTKTFSHKLTETLKNLMEKVNIYLGTHFNGILVNRYNNGKDYLSAHSDSKIDRDGIVAGLSFGTTRIFRIRDKKTKKIIFDYQVPPCSLLVMDGDFQQEYKHEIPKQIKLK